MITFCYKLSDPNMARVCKKRQRRPNLVKPKNKDATLTKGRCVTPSLAVVFVVVVVVVVTTTSYTLFAGIVLLARPRRSFVLFLPGQSCLCVLRVASWQHFISVDVIEKVFHLI